VKKDAELLEFAIWMINSFVKVIIVLLPTHCNLSVIKLKSNNRVKRARDKRRTRVGGHSQNNIDYQLCQYSY
jgi:hypothetical protein